MGSPVRWQFEPQEPQQGLLEKAGRALSLGNVIQGQQLGAQRLEEGRMSLDELRAAGQRKMLVAQAISEAGGDYRKALPKIREIDPQYALEVENKIQAWETGNITQRKAILDLEDKEDEMRGRLAGSMTDDATLSSAVKTAVERKLIDPATGQQMISMGYERAKPLIESYKVSSLKVKEQRDEIRADLDKEIAEQTLTKTRAEATMAGQEAELPIEERYELRRGRVEVPGVDRPYPSDVEAQRKRIAASNRAEPAADRKGREDQMIEDTAGDYLTEANGDANRALAQLEKHVRGKDVDPMLRRYAARIRFRIRERVRPGARAGRTSLGTEIRKRVGETR